MKNKDLIILLYTSKPKSQLDTAGNVVLWVLALAWGLIASAACYLGILLAAFMLAGVSGIDLVLLSVAMLAVGLLLKGYARK